MLSTLLRHLFNIIALAHLCSCALLPSTPESMKSDIDQWLSSNQYDDIDNAFTNIDPKDSRYDQIIKLKPSIKKAKNAYIESTSKTAQKFKLDNQWQKALDTYNLALENIENDPRLIKEKNELKIERDNQVNELRKDLLINMASALISYTKTYTKLNQLIPNDYSAQLEINRYEKEKIEVAEHLDKCGEQANKNKQLAMARDCYSLSNQLMPSKQKLTLVNKIDRQLKNKANKLRQDELLGSYKVAYNKKEYHKARMHLETLLAMNPRHKKANGHLSKLNDEVDALISQKLNMGKGLYSQKKISDALELWKQAQQLDPENEELMQLISRAEKVTKKIHKLEKGQ